MFRVKRPRLVFVTDLKWLADHTTGAGPIKIRIKENSKHSITIQTLCHEFAHHVEHTERGKTNHGDYFRRARHRIYESLERIAK